MPSGLVCVVLILQICLARGTFTSGFPSLDEVRGNGSLLVDTTTHTDELKQVLFPDINFTCDGRLTKLTFVALRGYVQSVDSFLNLLVESSIVENEYTGGRIHYFNATTATPIHGTATGYELQFQNGVPFKAGHVLGIQTQVSSSKYHFLYQLGEDITVCRRVTFTNEFSCTLESEFGHPLVAVEADPPQCASGFMDIDALRHIMAATSITTYPTSQSDRRYSRLLYFNCRNKFLQLKKWTVGARINEDGTTAPSIHIRTPGPNSHEIDTRHLSSLNATSYLNVYEYELSHRFYVWTDLYIAVHYEANPKIQIYYERYGLSTTVDKPLIAVDAECSSECGSCTSGFMSVDELREKARFIPNFAEVEDKFLLFPHMNITQDGYLVKWTFTAEDLGEDYDRTEYPELYILRLPTGDTDYMEYEYEGVESWMMDHTDDVIVYLNGSQSVSTNYPNVYEYTVEPPMPVQAGDFIAIHQPPDDNARLLLSFVYCPATETIHLERRDLHEDYERNSVWEEYPIQPLVSLQLDISMQATIPTKVLSPTLTATPKTAAPPPTDSQGSSDSPIALAVGASIAGVLVVMILSLLTLLAAVCLKKRRLMKTTPTISGAGTQDEDDVKVNPNEAYALHAISTAHSTEHTSSLPNASAVMTVPNEAYANVDSSTTVITTPNEAYAVVDASTTVITAPNEAYAVVDASTTVITAPNEAYAVVDASTTVITAPNEAYAANTAPNKAYAVVTGPSEVTGDLISSEAYSTATPSEVCPTAPNVAYGATTGQTRADDAHQLAYEAVQPQDALTYDYVTLQ